MINNDLDFKGHEVLGTWFVVAKEVGRQLGEKLNDLVDKLVPQDDDKAHHQGK